MSGSMIYFRVTRMASKPTASFGVSLPPSSERIYNGRYELASASPWSFSLWSMYRWFLLSFGLDAGWILAVG